MIASIASSLPSLAWTLIGGLLLTAGDVTLRTWFAGDLRGGFFISVCIYIAGLLCTIMSFFGKNIAIATVAAILVNVVVYLVISYWFYGDVLNWWQIAGIALGLAAITILEVA